jgi:50S ribosomal protein L16 3-hydroxylase
VTGDRRLNLDRAAFLSRHWQREPLLIKNAIDDFVPPLSSDELAGLALEEEVESRLIEQRNDSWHLYHGPFREKDFTRNCPWTLLVQAVDHYIPAVARLQQLVDFIPRWRTDDIMVSYATDGGGVGPHYDNYDVFLLQGEGRRLWRLGQHCDHSTPLLPHDELRILAQFEPAREYLLGPGDMLYVPPGIAHWGIAQGECTTFSIGFRAPRVNEMLSRWTDELLEKMEPDTFFCDAGRSAVKRPGELQARDLARAMEQLRQAMNQPRSNRWFGELVTEPRYTIEPDPAEVSAELALLRHGVECVERSPAAKLAWQQDAHDLTVFANGESLECVMSALPSLLTLCGGQPLIGESLDNALSDPDTAALLENLLLRGCIHVR